MTKLTDDQVAEIRALYPVSSLRMLANRFDVSRKTISVIVNNLSHKHPGHHVEQSARPARPGRPPQSSSRMKHYGLYMRTDQLERLKTVSQITGAPVSTIIRRAIDASLRKPTVRRPATLAEEMAAQDAVTWYGDPDAGIPVEGQITVGAQGSNGVVS
jgi:hypothetical protein